MKYQPVSAKLLLATVFLFFGCNTASNVASPLLKAELNSNGFLKLAPGIRTVQRECTRCHSEKLITQNRASREGWLEIIQWMQETQNLRRFSVAEEKIILDYLASNYAPESFGRRGPLVIREWYVLEP